jgi:hypothetical protein
LPQQLVNQRGLAVVDVGYDGDITDIISALQHKEPSFLSV